MRQRVGFTILEILIAIAILGVAVGALATSQISALRTTTRSQALTNLKAEANLLLEAIATDVLKVANVSIGSAFDDDGQGHRYSFVDYYWSCPKPEAPIGVRTANISNLVAARPCDKTGTVSPDGHVTTAYAIRGLSGVTGEGVINIAVTAVHSSGVEVTVGTAITCFEVYPSPTSEAPSPCPDPKKEGGGRSG